MSHKVQKASALTGQEWKTKSTRAVMLAALAGMIGSGMAWSAIAPLEVGQSIQIDGNHTDDIPSSVSPNLDDDSLDWTQVSGTWTKDALAAGTQLIFAPGVSTYSGLPQGTVPWRGVRILDGVGNTDPDIFATGGKENDTASWNVQPGSVGSAKFDMTQAYLITSKDDEGSGKVFFGMERRSNAGSVAFDFEFNQKGPDLTGIPKYVPTRTEGDVLFTFEVSSGSAVLTTSYFVWRVVNGVGSFVLSDASSLGVDSRANASPIAAPPWGFLNSRGNWATSGTMDTFTFAEAVVGLNGIPFLAGGGCGGSAYVQVRTRSSAQATSDLKDASRIFLYALPAPIADAKVYGGCDSSFYYEDAGSTEGATREWTFSISEADFGKGVRFSGQGESSFMTTVDPGQVFLENVPASGVEVTVTLVVGKDGCLSNPDSPEDNGRQLINVFPSVNAVASINDECNESFSFDGDETTGADSYLWTFTVLTQGVQLSGADITPSGDGVYTSSKKSGNVSVTGLNGTIGSAEIQVDMVASNNAGECFDSIEAPMTVVVERKLDAVASLSPECEEGVAFSANGSVEGVGASFSWTFTIIPDAGETSDKIELNGDDVTPGDGNWTSTEKSGKFSVRGHTRPVQIRAELVLTQNSDIDSTETCTDDSTTEITVQPALSDKLAGDKTLNAVNLSVTLASDQVYDTGVTYQWERRSPGSGPWAAISGKTSKQLEYIFDNDASETSVPNSTMNVDLDGEEGEGVAVGFAGKVISVEVRVKLSRIVGAETCTKYSESQILRKIIAVDP